MAPLLAQYRAPQSGDSLSLTGNAEPEMPYRRHFIIAFDRSPPFTNRVRRSREYVQQVVKLFSDSSFFNADQDEISFWSFGIPYGKFDSLNRENVTTTEPREKLNGFYNRLFEYHAGWQAFKNENARGRSIGNFLSQNINREYLDFGQGVTLSNLVYPLIINRRPKGTATTYANEYRLVILSDFLTGSDQGNKQDFRVLKNYVFGGQAGPSSTSGLIEEEFKSLDEKSFTAEKLKDINDNGLGILITRIRPRIDPDKGTLSGPTLENNLKLSQKGYRSEIFSLAGNQFHFAHNKLLAITEVNIIVKQNNDVILQKNGVKVIYNPDNFTYAIDDQELNLPGIANGLDSPLELDFQFLGTFQAKTPHSIGTVNYTFETGQNLRPDDISFVSDQSHVLLFIALPSAGLIIVMLGLLYYGKPIGIAIAPVVLLDSLEKVDFRGTGKTTFPYHPWTSPNGDLKITFRAKPRYRNENYLFNWSRVPVSIKFTGKDHPAGFRLVLRENAESSREFIEPYKGEMHLSPSKKGEFSFESRLTENDRFEELTKPEEIQLTLDIVLRGKAWGLFNVNYGKEFHYKFLVGPDLGKVWVGLDPGTTGTCIATGRYSESIIPYQVVPSCIAFDQSRQPDPINEQDPVPNSTDYYLHGTLASSSSEDEYVQFRSIKKLLGFTDRKTITFANKFELHLTGTKLTGMLVKGVFQDMKQSIEASPDNHPELLNESTFNPKRAVVAIPNNFTTGKIQDMIDAFKEMPGQFHDLRYVHEAEAILFYYLSKYPMQSPSETLLIFDMGGATINSTLVTITQKRIGNTGIKYQIAIRGKTGYGIGGDTIDYCLIRAILDHLPEHWKSILDPFDTGREHSERKKLTENWLKLTIQLKIELINAFKNRPKAYNLLDPDFLKFRFREVDLIDGSHEEMDEALDSLANQLFTRQSNGYRLFTEPLFKELIYKNVLDATQEPISVSGIEGITKIIFAGRSSHFPLIRETVTEAVKKTSPNVEDVMLAMEKGNLETKYAVALGACWYGLNKNAIELSNRHLFTNIGVQRRQSAQTSDLDFLHLIRSGTEFVGSLEKELAYSDTFDFDHNEVNFFQVNGQDPTNTLRQGHKHKFTRLATVDISGMTEKIGVRLSENDEVTCWAKSEGSDFIASKSALLTDQSINDANDEHYTWII